MVDVISYDPEFLKLLEKYVASTDPLQEISLIKNETIREQYNPQIQ